MNKKYYFLLSALFILFIACNNNGSGSGAYGKKTQDAETSAAMTDDSTENVANTKGSYNIYIENSGSMNGYVTSGSEFKNAILGFITDLKSKDIARSVNIYYINNTVCPQKLNATTADIQQFFLNLNPVSFQNSGCGTSTSNLPDIIHRSITSKPDDVNILISDFIFSDSAGTSQQYLELAKNSIIMNVSDALKKNDFSTIFLKFNSNFNGKYYTESQRPAVIDLSGKNVRRPYYMLVTGKNSDLNTMLDKTNFSNYAGYENSYYLFTPKGSKPVSKLVRLNKKGNFDIEQPATKMVLNNASAAEGEQVFQFSFIANLEFLKTDQSFITDNNNYDITDNYQIENIEKITDESNESYKGFTHIYTLSTADLKQRQEVVLKLKTNLPAWVENSSTLNDGNPADSLQQTQTFGFRYLVDGLSQAYFNTYDGREQFNVHIQVNKNAGHSGQASSSGFPWWIVIVFALLIGGFIFLKSKK